MRPHRIVGIASCGVGGGTVQVEVVRQQAQGALRAGGSSAAAPDEHVLLEWVLPVCCAQAPWAFLQIGPP